MAFIGGNTEKKEIGLPIGVSGTHLDTEIDNVTGYLRLAQIDIDGQGKPIYAEEGTWTSDVINLEDNFQDFEKVFTTHAHSGVSTFAILTRVSDNNINWSDWTAIAMDGTIQSDTKQYIQVKIVLYAGFVTDTFFIAKSDFNSNDYIIEKEYRAGSYIVPKLTSNTPTPFGFPFAQTEYSVNYPIWKAFDKADVSEGYLTKSGVWEGFLGYYFNNGARVSKYKVRSSGSGSYLKHMPNEWVLQGSNNTTNGHDGTWIDLDVQINQIWTTGYTDKEYEIPNIERYFAYRIKWGVNNGNGAYTGVGELDFYENGTTSMSLKREYEYDMTMDDTWSDVGSLHRQKITRDDWLRIDKFFVVEK